MLHASPGRCDPSVRWRSRAAALPGAGGQVPLVPFARSQSDVPHLARLADASPFTDKAPLPEQVGLHVQRIEAVHIAGGVAAMKDDGCHFF